jgi:hypothetical protein
VRGYQLRHLSNYFQKNYRFDGALVFAAGTEFDAALTSVWNDSVAGVSINALFVLSGIIVVFAGTVASSAAGASVVVSSPEGSTPERTETFPLNAGIDIINAVSMKMMAATIVIFDSTEAVPRGPNEALDTLLVNRAPASVLPGCSRTVVTSTMQERKKIVYKTYINCPTYL